MAQIILQVYNNSNFRNTIKENVGARDMSEFVKCLLLDIYIPSTGKTNKVENNHIHTHTHIRTHILRETH